MIALMKSNINFTGKVIFGIAKYEHERDEIAAAEVLSTLPKEAKGKVLEEIKKFKEELETSTPDEDTFIINFATDVAKTGILARYSPKDGIATCLGMDVLYEAPGIYEGERNYWGALALSQADFKTKDKKHTLKEEELQDNIVNAFAKLRNQMFKELAKIKASPEYKREAELRQILNVIG